MLTTWWKIWIKPSVKRSRQSHIPFRRFDASIVTCVINFNRSNLTQHMNKLYTLLAALLLSSPLFAQNVLLFEDFEGDTFDHILIQWPSGTDQTWIDADIDFLDDQSGAARPGEW